jgi:mannose-6-phosphate isomerase-like protein (cupin superfamily)
MTKTNPIAHKIDAMLRASVADLLPKLPGPRTARWPDGERFVEAFTHGSLAVELYAPVSSDPQTPHDRDEVYFVISGRGTFEVAGARSAFAPGDALFVAAGVEHRFENFSADFAAWVVFYGPVGGEPPRHPQE